MIRVGITQRISKNSYGVEVDSLEYTYLQYYASFGILLIPIPNTIEMVEPFIENLSIEKVILSGGGDIHPTEYGEVATPEVEYFERRDKVERKVLDFATNRHLPVLGICRGFQMINVYFGGSLIALNKEATQIHVKKRHIIEFTSSSPASISPTTQTTVNSYHHHGFARDHLAKDLRVVARTQDGLIEAAIHKSLPIAGIMWHPEREESPHEMNQAISTSFLNGTLFNKGK